jgi:hypothetical protein
MSMLPIDNIGVMLHTLTVRSETIAVFGDIH